MIELNDIEIGYNASLRKSFSLILNKPCLVGIVGPNGSGKSTFLKTVCGVIPPISGTIKYSQKQLKEISLKKRSKLLSLVSAENFDSGHFTVKDILSFGRYPYLGLFPSFKKQDHEKIEKTLKELGLEKIKDKLFSKISQGEAQRTLIGRALCQDTPIVFLDEPLSHLDPPFQVEILNLLLDYKRKNKKTFFMVSHYLRLTLIYADFLLILCENGKNYFVETEIAIQKGLLNEAFAKDDMIFDTKAYFFIQKKDSYWKKKCLLFNPIQDFSLLKKFLEKKDMKVVCYKDNSFLNETDSQEESFNVTKMEEKNFTEFDLIIIFHEEDRTHFNQSYLFRSLEETIYWVNSRFS